MRNYVKKSRAPAAKVCECGRRATLRKNSAWQCERCAAIVPEDYHQLHLKPVKEIREVSGYRLLAEWKEANA
jgi:hypothetical protein